MKRWMTLALLMVVATASVPGVSWAGGSEDAALALGAFAVFNQLIRGETVLHDLFGGGPREVVRERVIVQPAPPVVYAPPPPVVYAPPRPVVYAPPRAVVVAPPPVHVVRPAGVVVSPPGYKVYTPKHGPVVVVPPGYKVHPVKYPPHADHHYHHGH
jgi:hypothetical protein